MQVRTSTGGRVTLPATLRRQLNIKPGTRIHVEFVEATGQLVLTPITPEFVHSLRGKFKGQHALNRLMEERRLDREREDQKHNAGH